MGFGECLLVSDEANFDDKGPGDDVMFYTLEYEGSGSVLYVRSNFGCIQHEEKVKDYGKILDIIKLFEGSPYEWLGIIQGAFDYETGTIMRVTYGNPNGKTTWIRFSIGDSMCNSNLINASMNNKYMSKMYWDRRNSDNTRGVYEFNLPEYGQ